MANNPSTALLSRRLIFVVGKGGVGRSVTAGALALLAARGGARTILAESGGRGELSQRFGVAVGSGEAEIAPGLFAIQIETARALDEYLGEHLPLRMLADIVGATRLIGYLAAATPGLREMLNVGKLWELAQPDRRVPGASPYDVVVVDAPASGHALALLTAPRAFARTAGAGPIARQGSRIDEFLHDATSTAVVAVARAEDSAISELLELRTRLERDAELRLDLVVVNALSGPPLNDQDAQALRDALAGPSLLAEARAAIELLLSEDRLSRLELAQVARLRNALGDVAIAQLRRTEGDELRVGELETLATELEGAL